MAATAAAVSRQLRCICIFLSNCICPNADNKLRPYGTRTHEVI